MKLRYKVIIGVVIASIAFTAYPFLPSVVSGQSAPALFAVTSAGAAGLSAEERSDYEEYGLEVWSTGGRLPVNLGKPMEQFLEEHYIPTVVIEDRSRKPYLVNYKPGYFSLISESFEFLKVSRDGFQEANTNRPEDLDPGDYLMKIGLWTMVFDVVYPYTCYLHIVIPGGMENEPWPVTTPTSPPVSDPVPGYFFSPDGNWITPRPAFRPIPTPTLTPTPTPSPAPTPSPQ